MANPSHAAESIRVERFGDSGRPVVFIPGLATSGDVWRPWAERLQEQYDVRVVTLAGFAGLPTANADAGVIERAVSALASHLSDAGAENVAVVGHSLGGLMGLQLAVRIPDRVSSVLVVDSLPFLAQLYDPAVTPALAEARAAAMARQMRALPSDVFQAQQRSALRIQSKTPSFLPRLGGWMESSDQATVVNAMTEALATDYRSELAAATIPVLVLAAWDPAMPLAKKQIRSLYEQQYAALPKGRVRVVENSFHFIMIDQPAAFDAALEEVLAGQ